MDKMLKELLGGLSYEGMSNLLIDLNGKQLDKKEHIKKYKKIRKLHGDVMNHMLQYIFDRKYDASIYFKMVEKEVYKETHSLNVKIDTRDEDDITIFTDLFVYDNHEKIPSVTDIYLHKNIFRNEEKKKMVQSMKDSYVGLFKIVGVDKDEGYVTYEDVFTHKKFKVIDISMSSTMKIDEKHSRYIYNRIITYEDISIGTGIHCMLSGDNKELQRFIKHHKYDECSHFARCIKLYEISKKDRRMKTKFHRFG